LTVPPPDLTPLLVLEVQDPSRPAVAPARRRPRRLSAAERLAISKVMVAFDAVLVEVRDRAP
jgi:hypothetical protein